MPTFEVGSRKHIPGTRYPTKKRVSLCTCTKGASVRPTSRAYSDADPGLVCPTAAAAAAAAALLLEKLCYRCRTTAVVVCYEKLYWTSQIVDSRLHTIMPNFEVGIIRKRTTKIEYDCTSTSTSTKGARVRPTSRA